MLLSKLFPESKVENGRLTEAAHTEAVMAIKSQISNPSSYEGGSSNDAVWDSNSQMERYVLKHNFTCKNRFGERVRYIATANVDSIRDYYIENGLFDKSVTQPLF